MAEPEGEHEESWLKKARDFDLYAFLDEKTAAFADETTESSLNQRVRKVLCDPRKLFFVSGAVGASAKG